MRRDLLTENLSQAHVNHGDNHLTVTALRPIRAGEEILNYYGPHPNSELLRRYGYVTERHARYDVVEIPWEMVEAATVSQLSLPQEAWAKVVSLKLPTTILHLLHPKSTSR